MAGQLKSCPTPIGYHQIGTAFFTQPCHRWECPYCSRWKKWQLAKKVEILFKNTPIVKQITLTQKLGSKRNIMKDWQAMRQVFKRSGLMLYSYFWVKEFTVKGQRHLHIIADVPDFVSQKWLSDVWRNLTHGESFRVWINESDIENAAGYTMKYLTKTFSEECRFKKKERRYGFCKSAKKFEYPYTPINGVFWEIFPMRPFVGMVPLVSTFTMEYHGGDYEKLPN